jgi:hypothetical protein
MRAIYIYEDAFKNPFSCVYLAGTQALRLVSVVPENAAKAQRKKKATPVLYICGCFCMVGVVFIPETDNREHKTNRS